MNIFIITLLAITTSINFAYSSSEEGIKRYNVYGKAINKSSHHIPKSSITPHLENMLQNYLNSSATADQAQNFQADLTIDNHRKNKNTCYLTGTIISIEERKSIGVYAELFFNTKSQADTLSKRPKLIHYTKQELDLLAHFFQLNDNGDATGENN